MFQLKKTIVSEAIIENEFACNLSACKGMCCVHGDAGAPLDADEVNTLKKLYPKIKPFLREEGNQAIAQQGTSIQTTKGDLETPLVNGAECAYVVFDNEVALCGIEQAYNKGEISWKKPMSCHLYPIRVKTYSEFSAVNYHRWPICDTACKLGKELQVPVYQFVKEALVRKFGKEWFDELDKIAKKQQ